MNKTNRAILSKFVEEPRKRLPAPPPLRDVRGGCLIPLGVLVLSATLGAYAWAF